MTFRVPNAGAVKAAYESYSSGGTASSFAFPTTLTSAINAVKETRIGSITYAIDIAARDLTTDQYNSVKAMYSVESLNPGRYMYDVNDHVNKILSGEIGLSGGNFITTVNAVTGVSDLATAIGIEDLKFDDHLGFINSAFDDRIQSIADNLSDLEELAEFTSYLTDLDLLKSVVLGDPSVVEDPDTSLPCVTINRALEVLTLSIPTETANIAASSTAFASVDNLGNTVSSVISALSKIIVDINTQISLETTNISNLTATSMKLSGVMSVQGLASDPTTKAGGLLKNICIGDMATMVNNAPFAVNVVGGLDPSSAETTEDVVDKVMSNLGQPTPVSSVQDLVLKAGSFHAEVMEGLLDINDQTQIDSAFKKALQAYNIDSSGRSPNKQAQLLKLALEDDEKSRLRTKIEQQASLS